jgi:DNA segregation ATPase FtsK/SpoIIIE, S-DNA-T family
VEGDGGARRAVVVEVAPATTCAEVAHAITDFLGTSVTEGEPSLYSVRLGRVLPADRPALDARLRHGDAVELVSALGGTSHSGDETVAAAARSADGTVELVISGGPLAGSRHLLGEGDHVLGRAPECDIPLEDPSLSRRHATLRIVHGEAAIRDEDSMNATSVAARRLSGGEWTPLAFGATVETGRTVFSVEPAAERAGGGADGTAPSGGIVPLNRPPRVAHPYDPPELRLEAPPREAEGLRIPIGASFVPLLLGIALWLVTDQVIMLMFATLSPLMAIWTYVEDRRGGRRRFAKLSDRYRERVAALGAELEQAQLEEIVARRRAAPDPGEVTRRVLAGEPSLWERRPSDADFLSLRLGLADQPTEVRVAAAEGGSEELRAEGAAAIAAQAIVPSVPVIAHLAAVGVLGVAGPADGVAALGRWLVLQATALHSPRELVIAAALGAEGETEAGWSWLKWLPHLQAAAATVDVPPAAVGRVAGAELLTGLADLARLRRERLAERYGDSAEVTVPRVLVLLDERAGLDRARVTRLLTEGPAAGIHAIWLGRQAHDLPGECGLVAQLDPVRARMIVTDPRVGGVVEGVTADGLSAEIADEAARALSGLRDTGAGAAGAELPRRVDLLDLVSADLAPGDIAERWREADPDLAATIGSRGDEPLTVSLRRDGPHALIAGTTGAGKSELLQTLVASLALGHSPARLSFLLVDYKGGAAFKECRDLPHAVGMVTDLEGDLAHRVLISLDAELKRRERLLAAGEARDLEELERSDPETAPASLVIVIDEFATLVKEVPDFVEGVVDVAQRGRSLGVHLVLATQRPSGVVSESIRANTNLRIALRVASPHESEDVIGATDAGRIPRSLPGRAYARTGHDELAEFQAAYVGGPSDDAVAESAPVVVRPFGLAAAASPPSPDDAAPEARATDLTRIVAAVREAARGARIVPPAAPWLPELPDALPLSAIDRAAADGEGGAAIGLVDDPGRQEQRPLVVDLERDGGLLVYGGGGSGKTTLLRSLAAGLAESSSPDELHVYGLDYGGRGLASLESLPHCGSVIASGEQERTGRLFGLLRDTVAERRDRFAALGVGSLAEYRATAGRDPLPRILVLLDGYAAFHSAYERVDLGELVDQLPLVVSDGRAVGVHFAIAADRRGSVPGALAGAFQRTLALGLANEDDYMALGIDARRVKGRRLPPGRGFDGAGPELQVAIFGEEPSGESQARALRALGEDLAQRHGHGAPAIRVLPAEVSPADLPPPERPGLAVVGLREDLAPAVADLTLSHFLVAGPYRSGRSTALAAIARSLRAGAPGARLHLIAPRPTPLTELDLWETVAAGAESVARLEALDGADGDFVFVDDGGEIAEGPAASRLEGAIRHGRDSGLRVVAAAEVQTALRQYSGWLRELRKDASGLLLDPDPDLDGDLLQVRLPRSPIARGVPGRGYLVRGSGVTLVQVGQVTT